MNDEKKLTAADRARAIINHEWFDSPDTDNTAYIEEIIIRHILQAEIIVKSAAREEACRVCNHEPCDECMGKFETKGFKKGIEAAAKIVDQYDPANVAKDIRALTPSSEGQGERK